MASSDQYDYGVVSSFELPKFLANYASLASGGISLHVEYGVIIRLHRYA